MEGARYEIVIRGRLGRALEVMFERMKVSATNGDETVLAGYFQDQAALQGFLDQDAAARGVDPQVVYDEFSSKSALKSRNMPDDIAGSVVFLASDLARVVTGQAIYANSGESFH